MGDDGDVIEYDKKKIRAVSLMHHSTWKTRHHKYRLITMTQNPKIKTQNTQRLRLRLRLKLTCSSHSTSIRWDSDCDDPSLPLRSFKVFNSRFLVPFGSRLEPFDSRLPLLPLLLPLPPLLLLWLVVLPLLLPLLLLYAEAVEAENRISRSRSRCPLEPLVKEFWRTSSGPTSWLVYRVWCIGVLLVFWYVGIGFWYWGFQLSEYPWKKIEQREERNRIEIKVHSDAALWTHKAPSLDK